MIARIPDTIATLPCGCRIIKAVAGYNVLWCPVHRGAEALFASACAVMARLELVIGDIEKDIKLPGGES